MHRIIASELDEPQRSARIEAQLDQLDELDDLEPESWSKTWSAGRGRTWAPVQ